jgi:uncharacterized phage protein (TIGR02218 family)
MSDAWLAGPVTSTAYGWCIERRDGVTLGFTSHDRDIEVGRLLYRASPGMQPTSITHSLGIETDGLEIGGAIDHEGITTKDLKSGRWDKARISIFLFDWMDAQAGTRILAEGELGEISYSDLGFQADLRGLTAQLDAPVVPQTSPGCRVSFCAAACGLNARRFQHLARFVSLNNDVLHYSWVADNQSPPRLPKGAFTYGRLSWLEGKNCGLTNSILDSQQGNITLADTPKFVPEPGSLISLFQGCDKTIATCANRFANAVNFRGEPNLPGNDILTRYPGAG